MKKLTLLLAILLGLFTFGCGNKTADKAQDQSSKQVEETETKTAKTIDEIFKLAKDNMDTATMDDSDSDMLSLVIGLDESLYDEYRYMYPETNLNNNQILVVKGSDKKAVRDALDKFLKNQIELYSSYLAAEAEKLKAAEVFEVDDYVVLLVGDTKEEVQKAKAEIIK
ncbi:DUF4358 domain-containing protein [uncultured Ezakiella sp.]|uniref:DUF4358 domain-containing protein n=1 Tax=uncultured Ezakiella sp. TaxID=1637529 RepID=UPI0025FB812F|nr:DUF4358 domain-containing protein [uncultured Ezakiella sp.]